MAPSRLGKKPKPRPSTRDPWRVKKRPVHKHKMCDCCNETLHPRKYPKTPPTRDCKHPVQTCSRCMQLWIESHVETNELDRISCPECASILNPLEVTAQASAEVSERYIKLSYRRSKEKVPHWRWCLNPRCEAGQIHNTETDGAMSSCRVCNLSVCALCDRPWHAALTCTQVKMAAEDAAGEAASHALMERISKPCPNPACSQRIEKDGGCFHMSCVRCDTEFCWECMVFAVFEAGRNVINHLATCPERRQRVYGNDEVPEFRRRVNINHGDPERRNRIQVNYEDLDEDLGF